MHVVLVLVMALGNAACGPVAPTEDELARLDDRLDDGAYEEVLAEVTALEARTTADDADTRRELELLRVLAEAGRGDCRPVADLIRRGAPGVSERRLAHVVAKASDVALNDSFWHSSWYAGLWPEESEIQSWEERIEAARCVLEDARVRFPEAEARIDERLELIDERSVQARAGWARDKEIFSVIWCDGY